MIVLGDHVGLTCSGLRLGLVGLELVLSRQIGLLGTKHSGTCLVHSAALAFYKDIRMWLSSRSRRGQLSFGAHVDLLVRSKSLLLDELLVGFLLLDRRRVRVLHVALVGAESATPTILHLTGCLGATDSADSSLHLI